MTDALAHAMDRITAAEPLEGKRTLAQWGVKGMRWGFRKPETRGSTPPSKRKKGDGDDEADAPKTKKPAKPSKPQSPVKVMTDQELRARIDRMRLEQEYIRMTTPQKKKNVVAEVLAASGKQVATKVITTQATKYLNQAVGVGLNKALPEAYRVIDNGKKKEQD